MKFSSFLTHTSTLLVATIDGGFASITTTPAPVRDCEALCAETTSCLEDPQHHSSYCKYWQTPAVCFGLYYRRDGSVCFQPNDPGCPESKPVVCEVDDDLVKLRLLAANSAKLVGDEETTTEEPTTTVVTTTTTPRPVTDCEALCAETTSCLEDPHHHSSYCKTWQSPKVCFGLYYRPDGSVCFQPNDPLCPEFNPVRCTELVTLP